MSQTVRERIDSLRVQMKAENLDWFLDTGTDSHMSEYVAPHWRTRAFLTGFTGSAGFVLVGMDGAWLWTDSRYFIQAAAQLEGSDVTLMKLDTDDPDLAGLLAMKAERGQRLGLCAGTVSISEFRARKEALSGLGLELVACDDLVDRIWTDRPPVPCTKIRVMPDEICGQDSASKLAEIRQRLSETKCGYTFIAAVDDIAWITNLRADDVPCNPVFVSFLFIDMERAVLFTQKERFDSISLAKLEENFILYGYDEVCIVLPSLVHGRARYNDEKVSMAFCSMLGEDASVGRDWSTDLKARKNHVELEGMRKSQVMDAVAFINAFSRIDFSATDSTYSEISISDAFEEARKRLPGYLGPSFSPISGFGPNGAMCHYSATAESNAAIDRPGLLVLDTGSQFDCGMTDITRTLLFGEATAEQKKDYTLTLKGHLALSRAVFIQGTRGYQLDVLAKQFMWAEGMSFYHGTGHGVGFNLNVHEGPMRISAAPVDVPLETGMVISDEPGIYKEGRHGIRIENLIAVKEDMKTEFGQFLSFEVLTLVPYERRLIDLALLTVEERAQIDAYHDRIWNTLKDLVEPSARDYLRQCTLPLLEC